MIYGAQHDVVRIVVNTSCNKIRNLAEIAVLNDHDHPDSANFSRMLQIAYKRHALFKFCQIVSSGKIFVCLTIKAIRSDRHRYGIFCQMLQLVPVILEEHAICFYKYTKIRSNWLKPGYHIQYFFGYKQISNAIGSYMTNRSKIWFNIFCNFVQYIYIFFIWMKKFMPATWTSMITSFIIRQANILWTHRMFVI